MEEKELKDLVGKIQKARKAVEEAKERITKIVKNRKGGYDRIDNQGGQLLTTYIFAFQRNAKKYGGLGRSPERIE